MPRALTLVLFLAASVFSAAAQVQPVWKITAPEAPVTAGVPFTVRAEVALPFGYYQDADSPFLLFEPENATVISRSSSPSGDRRGKASFTGTFTLERTVVMDASEVLRWKLGWQICQVDGVCLLPETRVKTMAVTFAGTSVFAWQILLAAFLGGLLLNIMPCVFPVLALKLASWAAGPREGLNYALGSFAAVVALGSATAAAATLGQRLDWGFPFQQPLFVAALALVFLALTLSLWGVIPWRGFAFSTTPKSSRRAGAFLVVAAAPCTAPLLGPALGYALTRPPVEIFFFFTAIGAGLAAPAALLSLLPASWRKLPRSGRWLTAAERVAGVLLAGTVVYLGWVLFRQVGWPALLTLLLGLTALLVLRTKKNALRWTAAGGLLVLAAAATFGSGERPLPAGWKPYSATALVQALADGKPVFIDATADWCATCQVNEWNVLSKPEITALFNARGVVRLRADYTTPDEAIRDWLASVQRAGLPAYALYRPGKPPHLFSEVLALESFTNDLNGLLPR